MPSADWIRASGEFDALFDVEAALRDPANPARILPAYDSGDHLHPNDAGYQAMANAVPPWGASRSPSGCGPWCPAFEAGGWRAHGSSPRKPASTRASPTG